MCKYCPFLVQFHIIFVKVAALKLDRTEKALKLNAAAATNNDFTVPQKINSNIGGIELYLHNCQA